MILVSSANPAQAMDSLMAVVATPSTAYDLARLSRYATAESAIVHRTARMRRACPRRSWFMKPQVGRVGLEPTADGL